MTRWGISLPGRSDRVTGAIRHKATNALGEHAADGRLTQAELNERATLVYQAEHNHQLDALFADLPLPHPRIGVDANTGLILPGCLGALMVVITAGIWMDRGTWPPFAISTGVCLALFTVNGIIGTRRVRQLRESPHEQQRTRMRAEQYDTDNLRLGHKERVATAETLMVHAAAGLPREEYHSYVDRLPAVRTRGELKALIGHLPPPDPDLADTVRSPSKEDDRPWGFAVAITWLLILPGLPLAIAMWVKFGQWYWPLVWVGAVFVRYADWRLRKRRRARTSARRIPGMVD